MPYFADNSTKLIVLLEKYWIFCFKLKTECLYLSRNCERQVRKLVAFNPDQLAKFPVLSLPSVHRTGEVTAKRARNFPDVFLYL